MARSEFNFQMKDKSVDDILTIFKQTMHAKGYLEKIFKGEEIWCKGDSILTVMQCFNLFFKEKSVVIEAWIKDLAGESDLTGIYAYIPKKQMKSVISDLKEQFASTDIARWICPDCARENEGYCFYCECGTEKSILEN